MARRPCGEFFFERMFGSREESPVGNSRQRSTVVVQLIRNQQVMGSNPIVGSLYKPLQDSLLQC